MTEDCRHVEPPQLEPLNFVERNGIIYAPRTLNTEFNLNNAPKNLLSRIWLTYFGWCQLPTIVIPPGEEFYQQDLVDIIGKINFMPGPDEKNLIIRSRHPGTKRQQQVAHNEPAFIIFNVGEYYQTIYPLSNEAEPQSVDIDQIQQVARNNWLMIHPENIPLQRSSLQGRMIVDKTTGEIRLELAQNIDTPRVLDNRTKTTLSQPLSLTFSFANCDGITPNDILVAAGITPANINFYAQDLSNVVGKLTAFTNWLTCDYPCLTLYAAEFRYYTQYYPQVDRFHVLDLDTAVPNFRQEILSKLLTPKLPTN